MHLSVLGAYPDAGSYRRSISDEPAVGIVICGSRLSGDFTLEPVPGPQPCSGTVVDYTFHKVDHQICGLLADCLLASVGELTEHIAHIVLNSRNELRRDINTLGRECVVCGNHLVQ